METNATAAVPSRMPLCSMPLCPPPRVGVGDGDGDILRAIQQLRTDVRCDIADGVKALKEIMIDDEDEDEDDDIDEDDSHIRETGAELPHPHRDGEPSHIFPGHFQGTKLWRFSRW